MSEKFEGSKIPEVPKEQILQQFEEENRIMNELAETTDHLMDLTDEELQKLEEFKNKRAAIIQKLREQLGVEK